MSPYEEYILIGRADRYIIVYSPKEDREKTRFNCGGSVLDLKFYHDGTKFELCSSNYDKFLKQDITILSLWETGTWKKIKDLYDTNDYSSVNFFLNFSYIDNLLSCNYGIIDINSKQISYPNDGMHKSKYFDFYINDTHCFFYS